MIPLCPLARLLTFLCRSLLQELVIIIIIITRLLSLIQRLQLSFEMFLNMFVYD